MSLSETRTRISPRPNRSLRVLHLRNASGYYGAERCIVSWIRALSGRGFGFDLAVYVNPDRSTTEFLSDAREAGATVHELPRAHRQSLTALSRLFRVVRSRKIDLIHAHENRSHVLGWLVGGLTATPVIGTMHGYVPARGGSHRMDRFNQFFLRGRRLSVLTVPSEQLAREIGVDATVMPNAAPAALAEADLSAAAPPDTPTFGVVARLSAEKGVQVFLDAIAGLPDGWRFDVLGEGPERDALRSHPAAARVSWGGYRPDAADRMREWSALVVPSFSEGVPLTLLEAMAQGVPVIATRAGGIPEVLRNGRDAILVDVGDADALAAAMREVADDAAGACERAAQARARFIEKHTPDRVAEVLERIYRETARRRA